MFSAVTDIVEGLTHSYAAPERTHNDAARHRSTNCADGEHPTTMFTYFAKTDGTHIKDQYQSFMLSCQKKHFEAPDAKTQSSMKSIAAEAMSSAQYTVSPNDVKIEAYGVKLGSSNTHAGAKEVHVARMASNCGPDYKLTNVTNYNKFECRYMGEGIDDDGERVFNPFQTWKGTLPSCDDSVEIGPQLMHDIKKYAYWAADGDKAKLDVDKFMCKVYSVPLL